MKRSKLFSIVTAGCLALVCVLGGFSEFEEKTEANDASFECAYATDRIIVALKTDADYQFAMESSGVIFEQQLSQENDKYDVALYSIEDKTEEGVKQAIDSLEKNPAVAYAEPDYILTASDTVPNDPSYSQLYGMEKISAPGAWDMCTGTSDIVVGIIDSGVDYTHPDLANNIWVNPGEIAGNGIDDDANGYIDDIHGWNFVDDSNDPMDDNGHGTHVAGTVGAVGNNGTGVVGVNWTTSIAVLKFLDADGSGYTSDAILAINYAEEMGFDILNNSWGGRTYSQSLKNAITAYNGVFVAAAGNNGTNNDSIATYPACYTCSNIISVAATTSTDARASYSNYGSTTVDLGAPGSYIYSTYPNNSYATLSGTSMATPHVAGAAALIKSLDPTLTSAEIKTLILSNVDPVSSLNGITVTGGRLNVEKCLDAL
ncbi:S8 family peptidase [Anaeromicropila populeti]|uniref:Serine protease, subtilisin family n=1 Tax=Anaeromicropila populeti TaxID=37658 RepID=A0A1I6IM62_9FIRM|nr:S8 family peptidase [Anaeromicropila populeti]SFR67812.1 Serine protease, subtilisin family [Anaeromicropila populeti]